MTGEAQISDRTGLSFRDGKATGRRHCYELIHGAGGLFDLWIDQSAWKCLTLDDVVQVINDRERVA